MAFCVYHYYHCRCFGASQMGYQESQGGLFVIAFVTVTPNDPQSISNHRQLVCLFNSLFRVTKTKTPVFHITGLCEGNGFPSQRTNDTKNGFMSWHQFSAYSFMFILMNMGHLSKWPLGSRGILQLSRVESIWKQLKIFCLMSEGLEQGYVFCPVIIMQDLEVLSAVECMVPKSRILTLA